MSLILPIIDSHIHLYPESDTSDLSWCTPDHPLNSAHSVTQYKKATESAPSLLGFIFVETDRKNDISTPDPSTGWAGPLREVDFLRRVALGQPRSEDADGHSAVDAKLCLGIIPWAPIPSGPDVLATYLDAVETQAGDAWAKIKGFRYLVQDKPARTMTQPAFIDSLKLLGRRGFVFEVGIDHHRQGRKQLDEMLQMIERAHDGVEESEQVTFIINHLCKPDLSIYTQTDPSYLAWRTAIYALGKANKTYMKLSGCFSEMPESLRSADPSEIFQSIFAWLSVVLATFGPDRLIFGSDWPVCTVGTDDAWPKWKEIVEKTCWMASLTDEDRAMIFGGTAKKAYNL